MEKIKELKEERIIANEVVEGWVKMKYIEIREGLCINKQARFNLIKECDLNKKLFLAYNGALRQFKIKGQVFFPFNYTYDNIRCVILIDVCGIGEIWVKGVNNCYNYGELPFTSFESVCDFQNENPYEVNYETLSAQDLSLIYNSRGVCSFHNNIVSLIGDLFKWDGIKVVRHAVKNDVNLSFTWDGHIHINMEKAKSPYYTSEEECAENNSLKVECFADYGNEESEDEEETIVNLSFKVKRENVQKIMNFVDSL